MKLTKGPVLFALLLVVSYLVHCDAAISEKKHSIKEFSKIRTCVGISLKVVPAPMGTKAHYFANITADPSVHEAFKPKVDGDFLSLDFVGDFSTTQPIEMTVSMPSDKLKAIENYGVGTVVIAPGFKITSLSIIADGIGKIIAQEANIKLLKLTAKNMAEVYINGEIKSADVTAALSSKVYVGDVNVAKVDSNEISQVYFFGPSTMTVTGTTNGLGQVYVNNTQKCKLESKLMGMEILEELAGMMEQDFVKCSKTNINAVPKTEMTWTCGLKFSGSLQCTNIMKQGGSKAMASAMATDSSGNVVYKASGSTGSPSLSSASSSTAKTTTTGKSVIASTSTTPPSKDKAAAAATAKPSATTTKKPEVKQDSKKTVDSGFEIKSLDCSLKDMKTLNMIKPE